MILVFIGLPGSGKGTQAHWMVKKYNIFHLSTGDLSRQEIENKTLLGLEIKAIVDQGGYVSDEIVLDLINKNMELNHNYILDGFPRTLNQAIKLDDVLYHQHRKVDAVIKFNIDDNIVIQRLTGRYTCTRCGEIYNHKTVNTNVLNICNICKNTEFKYRSDDSPDKIQSRIDNYNNLTRSLEDYYNEKKLLHNIEAQSPVEEVAKKIEYIIQDYLKVPKAS